MNGPLSQDVFFFLSLSSVSLIPANRLVKRTTRTFKKNILCTLKMMVLSLCLFLLWMPFSITQLVMVEVVVVKNQSLAWVENFILFVKCFFLRSQIHSNNRKRWGVSFWARVYVCGPKLILPNFGKYFNKSSGRLCSNYVFLNYIEAKKGCPSPAGLG